MEVSDKDIYSYIVNLAEDRDVINMLSVNRKFSDDSYFKKVLEKRYPLLLRFKSPYETYKKFYLKMVKYMSKLWEKYKIPYVAAKFFNPESKYKQATFLDPYSMTLIDVAEVGDIKLAEYLIGKGGKITFPAYEAVGRQGTVEMLKFLMSQFSTEKRLRDTLVSAKKYNNREIINYLEKLGIKE